jgi:hypothetical protein
MRIVKPRPLLATGVVAVVAAALLVVAFRHTTTSGGPSIVSSKLPVVACGTTRGVPESGPAHFGRQLAPAHIVDGPQFSYYTDDARQVTPLLGPRGWRCHVLFAADGGVTITLAPPLAAVSDEPSSAATRITAESEPACQGCVYALVCAYIPVATREVGAGLGRCADARRRGARVVWLEGSRASTGPGTDIVRVDRPKVIECGLPATCWHTALIQYRWRPKTGGVASRESCGLTGTAYGICAVRFADSKARHWGLA